jgi:glyoxylase-like metal-dependent hydrolase (beta-lactamase superfamily II)
MFKRQSVKNRGYLFSWDTFGDCWLNLYLIKGNNRDYIIDSGLGAGSMEPVKALLEQDKEIVLINTHYHWDHIWGNDAIKNTIIIAHKLCREKIIEEWEAMMGRNYAYRDGNVSMRLPDLSFDHSICFPDDGLKLFFTPGHTKDSISILDEREGVLICGDNVGDTKEDIVPILFDGRANYLRSLETYMGLDFDTVISGHNDILDKNIFKIIIHSIT